MTTDQISTLKPEGREFDEAAERVKFEGHPYYRHMNFYRAQSGSYTNFETFALFEAWIARARIAHTELTEARKRIAELEAALEWQPIETVPRDGIEIDLWFGNAEFPERYLNCSWGLPDHTCGEAGQYCDSCPPPGELWRDWLCHAIENEDAPTHWRLSDHGPTAPIAEEKTDG